MTLLKGIVNSRTKDLRQSVVCLNCPSYKDDSIVTLRHCRKCPSWNKEDIDIDDE